MAFEELKERQGAMWGSGPFELVEASIADMHDELVRSLGVRPGEDWLDAGCGAGAVAERAARGGAAVTGIDLAPNLVETAKRRASEQGLAIAYEVGDCEALRFADASFDVVSSSVGVIFAPDHAQTASELARVTRPAGRIGLTAWHPDGRIGDFFRMMGAFQPPPPPGAGSPLAWGDPEYAERMLGADFELEMRVCIQRFETGSSEEAWHLFSRAFGPIVTALANLPAERGEELHQAFLELVGRDATPEGIRSDRTYTLILGRRR